MTFHRHIVTSQTRPDISALGAACAQGSPAPLQELWVHCQPGTEEQGGAVPALPLLSLPSKGGHRPHPETPKASKHPDGLGWIDHFHHSVVSNQVYSSKEWTGTESVPGGACMAPQPEVHSAHTFPYNTWARIIYKKCVTCTWVLDSHSAPEKLYK